MGAPKSDAFQPFALNHVSEIRLILHVQPDGSRKWTVHTLASVPSLFEDTPPSEVDAIQPANDSAVPAMESLITTLVLPAVAVEEKLKLA